MRLKKLNLLSSLLFSIQAALSVAVSVYLLKLNFLPDSVNIICITGIVILLIISAFLLIGRSKYRKAVCSVIAGIMSLLMIVPIGFMQKTDYTLSNLQGETVIRHTGYEILVRKDDVAAILNDIATYRIGIDTSYNRESALEALKSISDKLEGANLEYIEYSDSSALWQALVEEKSVDVVVIESSFYDIFEELYLTKNDTIDNYVKKVENITVSIKVDPPSGSSESNKIEEQTSLNKRPFVIYVSGIDVAGKITMRSRSDVNILIAVNPLTKKMVLATVPRDTYVPFPGVTNGQYDKLTHAGIYGDNCSVSIATLEEYIYTGVKIDRWIRVNFTSVERIVDALGGITVESEYNFSQSGHSFVKGKNYLNGSQALAFARNRKSFEMGDMQRGRHQLEVIKAIFTKAISPAILTGYSEVLEEVMDCIQTNLSYEDITKLVKMQLSDGASWEIEKASIYVDYKYDVCFSVSSSDKLCVGVMSETSRQEVVDKILMVLNGK